MKTKIISVGILCAITFCCSWGYAQLYNRAPDTLPGLTPEMYEPTFWINRMKNPDEIILTTQSIIEKNRAYQNNMMSVNRFAGVDPDRLPVEADLNRWPGRFIVLPDVHAMAPQQLTTFVRGEIQKDIDYIYGQYGQEILGLEGTTGQQFGNILGIEYADWELEEIKSELNITQIPNTIQIQDGIAVRNTLLRVAPLLQLERIGLSDTGSTRWDLWNITTLRICSPVSVLHTSKTGGYLFILSPEGCGWVKSEDVAFGDMTDLEQFVESDNFVVCTGDFVPFYSDARCQYVSGWFRMGDSIPLVSGNNPKIINAPFRNMNGEFTAEQAWLADDADVSIGYLPYTRRNIVTTAFKLMGNPYDWTMGWFGRNHETMIRDIFACFGFELPYHAELFTFYADGNKRVVRPEEGKEAQLEAIMENEPFISVQTCGGGHSHLYLGDYNGEPIVFDTHGYLYTGDDGEDNVVRRATVSTTFLPTYFLNTNFTFTILR